VQRGMKALDRVLAIHDDTERYLADLARTPDTYALIREAETAISAEPWRIRRNWKAGRLIRQMLDLMLAR
jgi:hypothetical protein